MLFIIYPCTSQQYLSDEDGWKYHLAVDAISGSDAMRKFYAGAIRDLPWFREVVGDISEFGLFSEHLVDDVELSPEEFDRRVNTIFVGRPDLAQEFIRADRRYRNKPSNEYLRFKVSEALLDWLVSMPNLKELVESEIGQFQATPIAHARQVNLARQLFSPEEIKWSAAG